MSSRYDDIINLPHHVSPWRRPMSMENRAAQFAPFAALTGHDRAIGETARLTSEMTELSPDEQAELTRRLAIALDEKDSVVSVTYFIPDGRKHGGSYRVHTGRIKKLDEYASCIIMSDGTSIPLRSIKSIEGRLFSDC